MRTLQKPLKILGGGELSTALFVLGPEAGLELADRRSIAALFAIPRPTGGWDLVASECFPQFTTHPS